MIPDHCNRPMIDPALKSDSDRGWDFRPYQEKRSAVWPVIAGIVCALIVCAVFSITQQG